MASASGLPSAQSRSPPSPPSPRPKRTAQPSVAPQAAARPALYQPLFMVPRTANVFAQPLIDELAITQVAVAAQQRQMAQQAYQARLAQQAQLAIFQAESSQSQYLPRAAARREPASAGVAPGFMFPSAGPDREQKSMPSISSALAGLTSYPFSPPSADSARRQSIVIGPDGHVDVVDSLAVLSLAQRQRLGPDSQQLLQRLAPFGESIWAVPPVIEPVEAAERASTAGCAKPVSSTPPTAPAFATLPDCRTHKRSDSETHLTKKAYLETGRRKSTAPHFPSRRAARKGSLPPTSHISPVIPDGIAEAVSAAKVS